jgi:hypothetical protein
MQPLLQDLRYGARVCSGLPLFPLRNQSGILKRAPVEDS